MHDIDGVLHKNKTAKVAPEIISVNDYQGLVKMLTVVCRDLDKPRPATLRRGLEKRLNAYRNILN
jgi:hypothetical protein